MECAEMEVRDLHARLVKEEGNNGEIDLLEEEENMGIEDGRNMWLEKEQEDLLNDTSLFYADFPPLPDFPCMSSSSSSSSATSAQVKAMAGSSSSSSSSSSSAASWAVLKSDADGDGEKQNHHYGLNDQSPATLASTASMEISRGPDHGVDCMDMMETFGYMDMLESNDFFDPSCIFQSDIPLDTLSELPQQENGVHENPETQVLQIDSNMSNGGMIEEEEEDKDKEDMGKVFLEWLRTNRETVSADDLRSVRIKKSTIECAARRLGGGKDAMKQLLKLVLEWVQTNHLQKRRLKETSQSQSAANIQFQDPFQSPNLNTNCDLNTNSITQGLSNPSCFAPNPWPIQHPPFVTHSTSAIVATAPPSYPPPMVGYMADHFSNGSSHTNHNPYPPPNDQFQMLDSPQPWPPPQFALASAHFGSFTENNLLPHQQGFGSGYGSQYPYQYFHGQGERLLRLGSSATKEARKKRMARQRRLSSHQRNHLVHQNHNQQNQISSQGSDHQQIQTDENCTDELSPLAQANPGNWVYWPSPSSSAAGVPPPPPSFSSDSQPMNPSDRAPIPGQSFGGKIASDRRQGWKPAKNLKFLLQKVLKQSDVGNLGRIVLPKKEAETHLPELEARDGISIAMEDIGTSRVWNMRYRYWPNNKSRMYLLENTGDFVRANGLQEGDFIVIYSDVKCGKYMIRGVKVRQPGPKLESKRQGKPQRNLQQNASSNPASTLPSVCPDASSLSPTNSYQ